MRRPRRLIPGELYDVTIRCHHSRFRLLPTKERRRLIGFFLAKYRKRHPDTKLLAVAQMGNHMHGIVWDRGGEISNFMRDFESQLAKALNRLDGVRGAVFERRYAPIPIVDVACLAKRIAYVVTNPVDAGLVPTHRAWSGLVGWFGDFQPETFAHIHEGRRREEERHARRMKTPLRRERFEETATLTLDPYDGLDPEIVRAAIEAREAELRKKHRRFRGMKRVLQQHPMDRVKRSKRSRMPLCLFTSRQAFLAFVEGWFDFLDAYRAASEAFRAGYLTVEFPMFSFRPSIPSSR